MMKAITARQPWAYAIAQLGQNVANRSRNTTYRGLLAIHAAGEWGGDDAASTVAFNARRNYGDVLPARRQGSGIVAVVDLVDVCGVGMDGLGCSCGTWGVPRLWHWRLANPRPLARAVPCPGRKSLWDLPANVEAIVLSLMREAA